MSPELALGTVLGLLSMATMLGAVWRSRQGVVRDAEPGLVLTPETLQTRSDFGTQGTLVLFTSANCAQCPSARRLLQTRLSDEPGLALVEVDLTARTDLTADLHILQTPTVFVLDGNGLVLGRIGGVPRLAELEGLLIPLIERIPAHVG